MLKLLFSTKIYLEVGRNLIKQIREKIVIYLPTGKVIPSEIRSGQRKPPNLPVPEGRWNYKVCTGYMVADKIPPNSPLPLIPPFF